MPWELSSVPHCRRSPQRGGLQAQAMPLSHDLREVRTHRGKGSGCLWLPLGVPSLLCICKPLLASRSLIKSLSECLSTWGGPHWPGGALSSGCENPQRIGLVPRKCHLVCLT